ncbi:MAG: hypothetical protein F2799_00860 [Actinobacteria bacterium]|uniref:Unannotated protein n=1 Tax=freshwater metagenome TaxID=449393 RepID=A0A6J7CXV2_9ZZZZ|nr:hypothetical protein [Actinomycetota bacterium]
MRRAIGGIREDAGQAFSEVIALAPLVVAFSLAIASLGLWVVGRRVAEEAASAGSIAVLEGGDGRAAAADALPGWARTRAVITVGATQTRVAMHGLPLMGDIELPGMVATVRWAAN